MTAASLKTARRAAAQAISANQRAAELAAMLGDHKGEMRYLHAARQAKARKDSLEREKTGGQDLALRVVRDRRSRSIRRRRADTLAELAGAEPPVLSQAQLRAGIILREHVEAANAGAVQLMERVDGGNLHNGQMESLCDRRRPVRYAMNAALEAVEDKAVLRGVTNVQATGMGCPKCGLIDACLSAGNYFSELSCHRRG